MTVSSTQAGAATAINIQRTSGPTSIITLGGSAVINIGSQAPASGGILNNIQGAVTVAGDGSTTLNVDDTGQSGNATGTLTSTALTGLGMGPAGISYTGLSTLNIALGGNGAFTVKSTAAGTATNINIPASQGHGPATITTLSAPIQLTLVCCP